MLRHLNSFYFILLSITPQRRKLSEPIKIKATRWTVSSHLANKLVNTDQQIDCYYYSPVCDQGLCVDLKSYSTIKCTMLIPLQYRIGLIKLISFLLDNRPVSLFLIHSLLCRAGKTLRFFLEKNRFLGFLGFNVGERTVARGTLNTGMRLRRRPTHEG